MTTSSTGAASPEMARRPVPFLDLRAQYAQIGEALDEAVMQVLRSGHCILGPEVEYLVEIDYSELNLERRQVAVFALAEALGREA